MTGVYRIGAMPRLVGGAGALGHLPETIDPGCASVLLVCDAGVAAAGLGDCAAEALGTKRSIEWFVAPAGEPTVATVDAAAACARALERPAIIGLGGGTALDIAKLVSGLARVDDGIAHYALGAATFPERAPAVMVPTTAGTGSEVTRTCILSDETGRKLWAWSEVLAPDAVVLDPRLTASLPRPLTVGTGLDAFVHALEAATGRSANPLSEAHALRAIRFATDALGQAASVPDDLDARASMQHAALLAGMAIDAAGTGIAHNIGHALGSLYHVPHGIAVALGLQASLSWSIEAAPRRFAACAEAFAHAGHAGDLAAAFDAWLDRLAFAQIAGTHLPHAVDATALAASMLAPENAPMARNSARPATAEDLRRLADRVAELCGQYARGGAVA